MEKKLNTLFDGYMQVVAKKDVVVSDDYNEIADSLSKIVLQRLFTEERTQQFIQVFEDSLDKDRIDLTEFMASGHKIAESIAYETAPQMAVFKEIADENLLVGIIIGHLCSTLREKLGSLVHKFHDIAQILPRPILRREIEKLFKALHEKEVTNG